MNEPALFKIQCQYTVTCYVCKETVIDSFYLFEGARLPLPILREGWKKFDGKLIFPKHKVRIKVDGKFLE